MADISMCANHACPISSGCYRFTAQANPYRQAYMSYHPKEDGTCDDFVPNGTAVIKPKVESRAEA